jgi:hypothetical protein
MGPDAQPFEKGVAPWWGTEGGANRAYAGRGASWRLDARDLDGRGRRGFLGVFGALGRRLRGARRQRGGDAAHGCRRLRRTRRWCRRSAQLPERGRPVDQRFRARVEPREPQSEPAQPGVCVRLEADDPSLAANERLAGCENDLEAEHDALRTLLRAYQRDARARQRVELPLKVLVFARIGARDPDRGRRGGCTRIVGHKGECTPAGIGVTSDPVAPGKAAC